MWSAIGANRTPVSDQYSQLIHKLDFNRLAC